MLSCGVDSYEQSIQRPTDNEEQKKNYSGKQKRHTKKNQVIVMPSGKEIVDVVVGETGATADINIWRKQRASDETSQKFQGDKASAVAHLNCDTSITLVFDFSPPFNY
ncbi:MULTISPECIES: transposase family protein [unclassified Microcoleus]|uniref:transposase family protein n=1 Tax=unclassified Microcoleus TaxID=2642155 RepID=UPI002FCEF061